MFAGRSERSGRCPSLVWMTATDERRHADSTREMGAIGAWGEGEGEGEGEWGVGGREAGGKRLSVS